MLTVDIIGDWRYKFDRKVIRETVEKTLKEHGIVNEAEVGVVIVGERKMRMLHKKYLETNESTDVLSFSLEGTNYPDGILRLGEVVICFPVAVRQAAQNNRMVDEEVAFLVDHGCKHLLGIHHEE